MIIDCHGHVSAPAELFAYKASILSHRGAHGRGAVTVTDDEIRTAANKVEMAPVGHLDMLKRNGTDMQLISPRPFQMMHNAKPARVVQAGVPKRMPLAWNGERVSKGIVFLFTVMPASSRAIWQSLPDTPRAPTSTSIRWLSVPPLMRRKLFRLRPSAIAFAFFTICC